MATGCHIHPCTQPHCLLAREHVDRDVGENNTKAPGMPPTKGKGNERLFSFSDTHNCLPPLLPACPVSQPRLQTLVLAAWCFSPGPDT